MIITVIVIVLYILNIIVARHLNKVVYKLNSYTPIWPWFWFIPIIPILIIGIDYLTTVPTRQPRKEIKNKKLRQFLGKNW